MSRLSGDSSRHSFLLIVKNGRKPVERDIAELVPGKRVDPLATSLFDGHETGVLKPPEMPARRRPFAGESVRDLAGGHFAAVEMKHEQNVASGSIRQRAEHRVDFLELG